MSAKYASSSLHNSRGMILTHVPASRVRDVHRGDPSGCFIAVAMARSLSLCLTVAAINHPVVAASASEWTVATTVREVIPVRTAGYPLVALAATKGFEGGSFEALLQLLATAHWVDLGVSSATCVESCAWQSSTP